MRDVPAAALIRGLVQIRHVDFRLDQERGDLLLDLSEASLAGAWVQITWRDPDGASVSPFLVSAMHEADAQGGTVASLMEEPCGRGLFSWTGRLPDGLHGLRLTELALGRRASPAGFTIRCRGRAGLLARALRRRPGLAVRAACWRCLGKKLRGRAMLTRALSRRTRSGYRAWIRRFDTLARADRIRIRAEIGDWREPPLVSVLMPVHDPAPDVLAAAIASVRRQLYPHWELCIVDDASTDPAIPRLIAHHSVRDPRIRAIRRSACGHIARATNDALALASGSFVAFVDHDDLLSEAALYEVARVVRAYPRVELVYSDEDKIDRRGRRFDPHFKSGFDRELLLGQNYVNHLTVVRTPTLRSLGGLRPGFEGAQDHDMLLRLTRRIDAGQVRHIPKVLYHWRAGHGSGTFSDRSAKQAEAARLRAATEAASDAGAKAAPGPHGFVRLIRPLPNPPPLVSVIVPTRDRADLLACVLDGLLHRTDYAAFEIVVVDNDSCEPETRALFARHAAEPRVRTLPVPGPFNFSDLSNRGATAARGDVLLFLNNDVEIVDFDWLTELVSIALDPGIGAVGAKLLYPDGTIQHAGVVLGIGGVAGHGHLGLPGDDPGYFARLSLSQEVSAVTGACLAMRKEVFLEVGGFDAEALKVAFNDVDLCLRIRQAGYRIVWTPHARLIHHESKSRGLEDTPEKRARFAAETRVMRERWEPVLRADPYYNPNLSRRSAHFRL